MRKYVSKMCKKQLKRSRNTNVILKLILLIGNCILLQSIHYFAAMKLDSVYKCIVKPSEIFFFIGLIGRFYSIKLSQAGWYLKVIYKKY